MAFEDSFAQLMADAGVPIYAADVPDSDTLRLGLDSLDSWFWGLDPAVREGFDDGSAEVGVCYVLAGELAIAPSLAGLLAAFDQAPGATFSQMVVTARTSLDAAVAADEPNV